MLIVVYQEKDMKKWEVKNSMMYSRIRIAKRVFVGQKGMQNITSENTISCQRNAFSTMSSQRVVKSPEEKEYQAEKNRRYQT